MDLTELKARISRLTNFGRRRYSFPAFERVSNYVRALSPGDRTIVLILSGLVLLSSVLGAHAFLRSVMAEVPARGGELVEGTVGSPRFINPLLAISDADRDLTMLTYAGLMGMGPDGSLIPVLAESYEIAEDGKTYTFVLRDNARFHDGTPVTAEDVVYTVRKAQDPSLKSPEFANWANITAEVVDARTVRFLLPKAYSPFLKDATLGILPSHLWRSITSEEFPFSTLMTEPVGAGPFKVSRVVRDSRGRINEYQLSAFGGYATGRAYLNGIRLVFYPDQEALAQAVSRGSVQSAYGVEGKNVRTAPYARVFGVFFNAGENPAFARLAVRKALSLMIDREKLVNQALGGHATALMGPVPPGGDLTPTPLPVIADRLVEARSILEEDGWAFDEESGEWKHEGEGLSLSVRITTSNVPELKNVASAVRDDWQTLGVPVALEIYEPGDLTQTVIRPRKYQALLFGMVIGQDQDLFAFWNSSERNDPGLNIALYANSEVDELLAKVRAESDPLERQEDLQKLSRLIAEDYPAAFTHAPNFLYVMPKDVRGVILPQISSPSDRFATVANWYRFTESVWPFLAPTTN